MSKQDAPIGIFDSGIGGTSIWKEIRELLPGEDSIYLADSKNAPYGERPADEILELSIKNTELLLGKGCKLVVVACNTATTNAIDRLRATYDVPFIGIEPAIKPAALKSVSKRIGVLATRGTLTSALFNSTSKTHGNGIQILEQEGRGLVPLIEAGKAGSLETKELLATYLEPMLRQGIDHLVLGCTHYPYLVPVLKELLPESVNIIDCGQAVARQTKHVLETRRLLNPRISGGQHAFYTNVNPGVLRDFVADYPGVKFVEELNF